MEIRVAAYLLFFSLLVSHTLGSCAASINQQEQGVSEQLHSWITTNCLNTIAIISGKKTLLRFAGSSSNRGVSCSDEGKAVALKIRSAIQRRLLNQSRDHHQVAESPKSNGNDGSETRTIPHWAIYTLAICGAALFVVAAATTMYYLLFSRRNKDNTVMPWSTGLSGPLRKAFVAGVPSLGRTELQTACEDFINVIGSSSECILYKGTLSSGVEIAVVSTSADSAKDWSYSSEEQFKNKISMLSKVNHKNLMDLLGYCTCDEPFTRMMVFEYAPCGSLFEHLHIREAEDLDWPTPLNGMADPMLRSSVPDKDLAALCDVEERRPGMGEVARLMRGVTALSPEQTTPRDNPLWWAELEIASTVESG
ncbi:putative LRR receptor-like serine/threonine-protein kinase MRH1 [Panicum miliaceum]|uniref:LRR receptor-like serine/threonine-protein kinase MRH1 n=1 Tax=Panicum miliaceum TaxID=4540 RepID=A0A3L6QTK0_PANMI|nr:putative LRR receptor-like serine/threonine-protein kinase MRH1 [Panicum miliaceum]